MSCVSNFLTIKIKEVLIEMHNSLFVLELSFKEIIIMWKLNIMLLPFLIHQSHKPVSQCTPTYPSRQLQL